MYRVASKPLFAAVVANLLIAQPAMATRSASSLPETSAQAARTASPMGDSEELQGGWLIPALAIIAVLLGILAATSGGDNDSPG